MVSPLVILFLVLLSWFLQIVAYLVLFWWVAVLFRFMISMFVGPFRSLIRRSNVY